MVHSLEKTFKVMLVLFWIQDNVPNYVPRFWVDYPTHSILCENVEEVVVVSQKILKIPGC